MQTQRASQTKPTTVLEPCTRSAELEAAIAEAQQRYHDQRDLVDTVIGKLSRSDATIIEVLLKHWHDFDPDFESDKLREILEQIKQQGYISLCRCGYSDCDLVEGRQRRPLPVVR